MKAARAYRLHALGALRAMSRLRASESEAFVARSSHGAIRAVSRRGCQEPVWAVSGHGEGEGMVKSRAYRCDQNRVKKNLRYSIAKGLCQSTR